MASEYGWTDEQIGELPLVRLRQVTAAIQMRRFNAMREENGRVSWLARNLATFIAAGYMTDGKKENKALKHAAELAYDDIEAVLLGAQTSADRDKPKENAPGSFERFMMMDSQLTQRGRSL